MGNVTFRQSPCWQTPLSLTHLCQHVRSNGRKAQGFPLSLPLTISGAGGVICHTAHSWSLLRLSKLASFCLAMLSCVGLALQCFGSSLRSWAWRARCLASEALTYALFVFTVVYYFFDYRLAEVLFGLSFHVAQSRNRLVINFTQSLTPDILLNHIYFATAWRGNVALIRHLPTSRPIACSAATVLHKYRVSQCLTVFNPHLSRLEWVFSGGHIITGS
jgi:hypothetical protein